MIKPIAIVELPEVTMLKKAAKEAEFHKGDRVTLVPFLRNEFREDKAHDGTVVATDGENCPPDEPIAVKFDNGEWGYFTKLGTLAESKNQVLRKKK